MDGDKLSISPRRNPVNLETGSISMQHCCSEVRHVKMVSSEALPVDDGRARSSYSPSRSTSAGMCWEEQDTSSNPYWVLSHWWGKHLGFPTVMMFPSKSVLVCFLLELSAIDFEGQKGTWVYWVRVVTLLIGSWVVAQRVTSGGLGRKVLRYHVGSHECVVDSSVSPCVLWRANHGPLIVISTRVLWMSCRDPRVGCHIHDMTSERQIMHSVLWWVVELW